MQSALFIGRFQPFHKGHLAVCEKILSENGQLIIAIGSSQESGTEQNPYTFEQRKSFIEAALKGHKNFSIHAVPDINDYPNWVAHLNKHVPHYDRVYTGSDIIKFCFKDFDTPIVDIPERHLQIEANKIRQKMANKDDSWKEDLPSAVASLIEKN